MKNVKRWSGLIPAMVLGVWANAQADAVTEWNEITVGCVQGSASAPANRSGPAGLLDIALVQAAVHDAVQTIEGRFEPYEYENKSLRGAGSLEAAAASAAFGVLKGLYGADDPCLVNVADPDVVYAGDLGLKAGREAAAALLPLYRPTMVLPTDPFVGSTKLGQWRPQPGQTQGASTFLAVTAPFAMTKPRQFRPGPPPHLKSLRYAIDYNEVKRFGSSTSSARTAEQAEAARFWTANFFVQMNQSLRHLAETRVPKIGDKARLFALAAFAMADSQISIYETKYHYNYWRPITAIQEGDVDGNPLTRGDAGWTPMIATPPYPDYTSGANCLAASVAAVVRGFFGTDKVPMSMWTTASGVKKNPRTYRRLSELEQEMVGVRVWQGIHFRTAETVGREQGARIGEWTYKHYLRPVRRHK